LILAALIFGTVVVQVRRFPERTGAYLLGVSVVPDVLLGSIVARMPACGSGLSSTGECYAPVTSVALVAYAVAGVVGALLVGLFLRQLAAESTAS
jgi:hypothetical protein